MTREHLGVPESVVAGKAALLVPAAYIAVAAFDIFFNKAEGLPRADHEIEAAAASRLNG